MRTSLNRILFRRKTKRIPAHRVKHIEAAHTLETAEDIRGGVAFRMAHVQPCPARIREHIQTVKLRLSRLKIVDLEGLVLFPIRLPFLLDDSKIVLAWCRCHKRLIH